MSLCLIPITEKDIEYSKNKKVGHCTKCEKHCLVYAEGFVIT